MSAVVTISANIYSMFSSPLAKIHYTKFQELDSHMSSHILIVMSTSNCHFWKLVGPSFTIIEKTWNAYAAPEIHIYLIRQMCIYWLPIVRGCHGQPWILMGAAISADGENIGVDGDAINFDGGAMDFDCWPTWCNGRVMPMGFNKDHKAGLTSACLWGLWNLTIQALIRYKVYINRSEGTM